VTTDFTLDDLRTEIEAGWQTRDAIGVETRGPIRTAVEETIARLDTG
jgi:2,3,4,5-tetrahydropyridine-2-carboxylate N-succinyltransferase